MGAQASTQMDTAGQFFREEKCQGRQSSKPTPATSGACLAAAGPADSNHSPRFPVKAQSFFQLQRAQSIFSESTDDGDSTSTSIDTPGKFLRVTSKSSVDARKARTHRRPKGDDDDVSRHCSKTSLGSFAQSSESDETTPRQASRDNQCFDPTGPSGRRLGLARLPDSLEYSPSGRRFEGCTNEGDSDAGIVSRGGSKPSLASHGSRSSSTSARLRQKAANGTNHLKASMCAKGGA